MTTSTTPTSTKAPMTSTPPTDPNNTVATRPARTVIVAALDRTAASDAVLETATGLVKSIPGAELHLINVIVADVVFPEGVVGPSMRLMFEEGRTFIDGMTERVASTCAARICGHLAVGAVHERVLQLAADLHADYIVVGTHGKRMLERMILGSASEAIVKKALCTVIVARPKEYAIAEAKLHIPEIEPPCKACVETQQATNGEKLWCAQHSSRHAHGRLHYEVPPSFGVGSMLFRPE